MTQRNEKTHDFRDLLTTAKLVSDDAASQVQSILDSGQQQPLTDAQALELVKKAISVIRQAAVQRGDQRTLSQLEGDIDAIANRIVSSSARPQSPSATIDKKLHLSPMNGIRCGPVLPTPVFHGHEVPMNSGWVRTKDLTLWPENERLEIHLGQFESMNGRPPSSDELLDIMLTKMRLPGADEEDEFEIVKLAESIAVNGVQRPPILDLDGTPLDGNRRIAACNYILASKDFTAEEKKRAENMFVWQLTEHATDQDRDKIVTALNFEPANKKDWPDYVRARKVYAEWQSMLALEGHSKRHSDIKKDIAKRFALGDAVDKVNRFIRMVEWADDFKDFHVNERKRDNYTVEHRAKEYFQYFDELSKGKGPGTVAVTLQQNEPFKHLVFDLLFERKFKNFMLIRDLKFNDSIAMDELREALQKPVSNRTDLDTIQDDVEDILSEARARHKGGGTKSANGRIEQFVGWLESQPVSLFRDEITEDNLQALLRALKLVESHVAAMAKEKKSA